MSPRDDRSPREGARPATVGGIADPAGQYKPQLDALRAFAVLAHHFHFFGSPHANAAIAGVRLFFVLSGFLITDILLRAAVEADAGHAPRLNSLRRFYLRRALRIFPLYYGVIAACWILDVEPPRRLTPWLLTYTLNVHMAHQGWYEDTFAHFWSLNVEEQFYLVWPWLVLLCAPKRRVALAIAMITTALAGRLLAIASDGALVGGLATFIGTPMCLDSLGAGALLAMMWNRGWATVRLRRMLDYLVLPLSLLLLVGLPLLPRMAAEKLTALLNDTLLSFAFVWLVARATWGFTGSIGAILTWAPITYVGKISYGLYVYHPFVEIGMKGLTNGAESSMLPGWVWSATATALTLLLASVSWFVLERPLIRMKRYV